MKKDGSKILFPTIKKGGINYLIDKNGRIRKFKPWLGDVLSFLYDKIMEKSIFPKLFGAKIETHFEILKHEFHQIHNRNILEIACGSGTLSDYLPPDNKYTGIDISTGLLKQAHQRLKKNAFKKYELFNVSVEEMPFSEDSFDFAVCNLSLNFFKDINLFLDDLARTLNLGSTFFCSIPIPERKPEKSTIRGTLYTETELHALFSEHGFEFESKQYKNGALLYFTARLLDK